MAALFGCSLQYNQNKQRFRPAHKRYYLSKDTTGENIALPWTGQFLDFGLFYFHDVFLRLMTGECSKHLCLFFSALSAGNICTLAHVYTVSFAFINMEGQKNSNTK